MGRSLGIDLLCVDSICSFECVYCQLGKINNVTTERAVFVPTHQVLADLEQFDWRSADVITFSGSGEPTLAANLGQAITAIREFTAKPVAVLTNSTLLKDPQVRAEIALADRVYCKLDAWSEEQLSRIDRPAAGISLDDIIDGIVELRSEFGGFLAIQTMLLSQPDENAIRQLARQYSAIRPDEIELNLPLRPIPERWNIEARGNIPVTGIRTRNLKTVTRDAAVEIGKKIAELTGLTVVTPFDRERQHTTEPAQYKNA